MPPDARHLAREQEFRLEKTMQSAMMRALRDLGFDLRYHVFRSTRNDRPGFLDITAINRRAGLLWTAELKGPATIIRPAQLDWIEGWASVRRLHCAGIIRPAGYDRALADLVKLLEGRP